MALSLRDVMARPSDAEAMELLMGEYTKYCVGGLDEGGDMSVDEDDESGNGTLHCVLPVVDGAFNVRVLSRVDFPRTWIVPSGSIPSCCFANTQAHGRCSSSSSSSNGGDGGMAPLVDYSRMRCIVYARSELLKPPGECRLPQKVLAVWPDAQPKVQQQQQQQGEKKSHHTPFRRAQTTLYWPAYVTRVVGVFEDALLDGSPSSYARLQEYEDFHDLLVCALRSPMRVCVDVTFCIDETSEAHRLTIAPALRYPGEGRSSSSTTNSSHSRNYDNDEEVIQHSELVRSMMKGDCSHHRMVQSEMDCPQLIPEVMPQVVSIRNYSYTAVAGKGRRRSPTPADGTRQSPIDGVQQEGKSNAAGVGSVGKQYKSTSHQNGGLPCAATHLRSSTPACGVSSITTSKAKLNRNTLSHGPIALLDMLAGPICQTQQFVFLRPTAQVAMAAQRAAIAELQALWQRLRRALLGALHAREVVSPTVPIAQLPDPDTYESPYLEVEPVRMESLQLPPPPLPPSISTGQVGTEEGLPQHRLPILQGHIIGQNTRWRLVPPMEPSMMGRQSTIEAIGWRGSKSVVRREGSPSMFRTHDPDGDAATTCYSAPWEEGGTEAGFVGGPSRAQSRICSASVTVRMMNSPCRSSMRSSNSVMMLTSVTWAGAPPNKKRHPQQQQQQQQRQEEQQQRGEWGKPEMAKNSLTTTTTTASTAEDAKVQKRILSMQGPPRNICRVEHPSWRTSVKDEDDDDDDEEEEEEWLKGINSTRKNSNSGKTKNRNSGIMNAREHRPTFVGTCSKWARERTQQQQQQQEEEGSRSQSPKRQSSAAPTNVYNSLQQRYAASRGRQWNDGDSDEEEKKRNSPVIMPPPPSRPEPRPLLLSSSMSTRAASVSLPCTNTDPRSSIGPEKPERHHQCGLGRSCSVGRPTSNRFSITSWRDESGVEITVDDTRLLLSALEEDEGMSWQRHNGRVAGERDSSHIVTISSSSTNTLGVSQTRHTR